MMKVTNQDNLPQMQNIYNIKKKSLKDSLKETHQNKNNLINMLKMEIDEIGNNFKKEERFSKTQVKENKVIPRPSIKKLKLIENDGRIDKTLEDLPVLVSNLRKIYVDLNRIDNNNSETDSIILNQRIEYNDNSIRTCQYTIITFLPLALFNQFKSAFNWFFLIYNIIATIPALSDLDPLAEVTPFIVVLILNLIKEAIEDYRKHNNDKKANESNVLIFKDKRFKRDLWQNIRVGNIIKIYKEDLIPADVLIIKSSLKTGLAYMQTSNLDGENTLKPREALHLTQIKMNNKVQNLKNIFDYKNDYFFIEVIQPNKNIYDIEGTAFFDKNKNHISIKNVLLRGARLKNVDYVYGIVIYNGHDTKLMQNIEHSSTRFSSIDVKLNYIV